MWNLSFHFQYKNITSHNIANPSKFKFGTSAKLFNEIKTPSKDLHYLCRLNVFYLKITSK